MAGNNQIVIAGESKPSYAVRGAKEVIRWTDPGVGDEWTFDKPVTLSEADGGGSRHLVSKRVVKGKSVSTRDELDEMLTQVVIHADCTATSKACYQVLIARGLSIHFLIDWDGTLIQCADVLLRTYHAGDANNHSIGIEMNNHLRPGSRDEVVRRYTDYDVGAIAGIPPGWKEQERRLSEPMKIQNMVQRCYGYTDAQYSTLIGLLQILAREFPNMRTDPEKAVLQHPMDETGQVLGTVTAAAPGWRGMVAHWHLSSQKWDPGPGFDWQRVYHGMRGERNFFPIALHEDDPPPDTLEDMMKQAEEYYANTDKGGGGYYPIGINQTWHGGIHLHAPEHSPVRSMLAGEVVAARFGGPTPLGSNNFVLLRHWIDLPELGQTNPENFTKLKLYSLFMHLGPIDWTNPESWPSWLTRVYEQEIAEVGAVRRIDQEIRLRLAWDAKIASEGPQANDMYYAQDSPGLTALLKGQIARFETKPERRIEVAPGDSLGTVGLFGSRKSQSPLVHTELFTDHTWRDAIKLALHSRHWQVIEEAEAGRQKVNNPSLLSLLGARTDRRLGRREFLFPPTRLDQRAIEGFYEGSQFEEERDFFRRAIVRFTSEWSDQVEWIRTLTDAQDWAGKIYEFNQVLQDKSGKLRQGVFTRDILDILRFTWLTKEVAEHIGLEIGAEWDGMLYHFHPIHFLVWLSFHSSNRVRVLAKGMSRKEILQQRAEERAKREARMVEEVDIADAGAYAEEFDEGSTITDLAVELPNPTEPFRNLRDVGRRAGLGTWERENN